MSRITIHVVACWCKLRVCLVGVCPRIGLIVFLISPQVSASVVACIMAGGETGLPADTPSGRLDTEGEFAFVGALAISNGSRTFRGTAVALSPDWVLTAGHNADLNDDGLPDANWSAKLHLPDFGVFNVAQAFTLLSFSGFANPAVNDDLALLRLTAPLPQGMGYPTLGKGASIGDVITLVGFGRSGYGSYGYTTNASLTDRRFGNNVIDGFQLDDEGAGVPEVFSYDFDDPMSAGLSGGSLGNDLETIICPGDSGGPSLRRGANEWEVVGINTYTEGYGGRFGDTCGGVLIEPYIDWIRQTSGIPESDCSMLWMVGVGCMICRRRNHRADG